MRESGVNGVEVARALNLSRSGVSVAAKRGGEIVAGNNEGAVFSATDVWKLLDGKIASYKVPTHVVIMNEENVQCERRWTHVSALKHAAL